MKLLDYGSIYHATNPSCLLKHCFKHFSEQSIYVHNWWTFGEHQISSIHQLHRTKTLPTSILHMYMSCLNPKSLLWNGINLEATWFHLGSILKPTWAFVIGCLELQQYHMVGLVLCMMDERMIGLICYLLLWS